MRHRRVVKRRHILGSPATLQRKRARREQDKRRAIKDAVYNSEADLQRRFRPE